MKLYLLIDHWRDDDLSPIDIISFLSKLGFLAVLLFFNPVVLSRNKNNSQKNGVFSVLSQDCVFRKSYELHINIRIREHNPYHGITSRH